MVGKDLEKGSGSGIFRRGKRITNRRQLRKGQFVIDDSKQFNATNVAKVKEVESKDSPTPGVSLVFVNPENPSRKRNSSDRDFFLHDFDIENIERTMLFEAKR